MNKRSKIIVTVVTVVILAILGWLAYNSVFNRTVRLETSDFISIADNSGVLKDPTDPDGDGIELPGVVLEDGKEAIKFTKIEIGVYTMYGYVEGEDSYSYYAYGQNFYNQNDRVDNWMRQGLTVDFKDPNEGSIWSSLSPIIMMIVMCVIFWFIINQTAGGGKNAMSFGKTKAKITNNIKVRFSDVAGAEEEKAELQEVTEFLKNPAKFSALGARIPKGVLLVGPPGTGKTLFAKAVAGEAGVPFFSVSGSDFVEMYVGVGASRVRDLFDIAKKNQPCIIFIDEIDAVGRERGAGLGGGSDEREQTLNQILVQMDGFEASEAVIVMAATNRSDVLDPALMRPGRFDRKIMVNLPDVKGREAILKVHARNKPLAPNVNFKTIARITSGFSGADLENLLNEAAILTARAGKTLIGNVELYEGVNKVLMGPQKKSYVVTESDKRCTAYHEAGHAIIAATCKYCDPVQEVSIIPRGNAAGYTMTRPDSDDKDVSLNKLNDMLCMMLGGRVAEELVIQDVTTGASNDLQRASSLARRMVVEWGMSDLGLISYGEAKPIFVGRELGSAQEYSDATAAKIDAEVQKIIQRAHERAVQILTENRGALDNMARLLVDRETIYNEEVTRLLNGESAAEVGAYMDGVDAAEKENPFARFEASFKGETPKTDGEKTAEPEKAEPTADENGKEEPKSDGEEGKVEPFTPDWGE